MMDASRPDVTTNASSIPTTAEQLAAEGKSSRGNVGRRTAAGRNPPHSERRSPANVGDGTFASGSLPDPEASAWDALQGSRSSTQIDMPDAAVGPQALHQGGYSSSPIDTPDSAMGPQALRQGSRLPTPTDTPDSGVSPRASLRGSPSSAPIGAPDAAISPQASRQRSRSVAQIGMFDSAESPRGSRESSRSSALIYKSDSAVSPQAVGQRSRLSASIETLGGGGPLSASSGTPDAASSPQDMDDGHRALTRVGTRVAPAGVQLPPNERAVAAARLSLEATPTVAITNSQALSPTALDASRYGGHGHRQSEAVERALPVQAHWKMAPDSQPGRPPPAMQGVDRVVRSVDGRRRSSGQGSAASGATAEMPRSEKMPVQYGTAPRPSVLQPARGQEQAAQPTLPAGRISASEEASQSPRRSLEPPANRAADRVLRDIGRPAPVLATGPGPDRPPRGLLVAVPSRSAPGLLSGDHSRLSTPSLADRLDPSSSPGQAAGGRRGSRLYDPPVTEARPPPHIEVTIGRVEVHTGPEAAPPRPTARRPARRIGIEEYLRRRGAQNAPGGAS